jgi:hypothetical protein
VGWHRAWLTVFGRTSSACVSRFRESGRYLPYTCHNQQLGFLLEINVRRLGLPQARCQPAHAGRRRAPLGEGPTRCHQHRALALAALLRLLAGCGEGSEGSIRGPIGAWLPSQGVVLCQCIAWGRRDFCGRPENMDSVTADMSITYRIIQLWSAPSMPQGVVSEQYADWCRAHRPSLWGENSRLRRPARPRPPTLTPGRALMPPARLEWESRPRGGQGLDWARRRECFSYVVKTRMAPVPYQMALPPATLDKNYRAVSPKLTSPFAKFLKRRNTWEGRGCLCTDCSG